MQLCFIIATILSACDLGIMRKNSFVMRMGGLTFLISMGKLLLCMQCDPQRKDPQFCLTFILSFIDSVCMLMTFSRTSFLSKLRLALCFLDSVFQDAIQRSTCAGADLPQPRSLTNVLQTIFVTSPGSAQPAQGYALPPSGLQPHGLHYIQCQIRGSWRSPLWVQFHLPQLEQGIYSRLAPVVSSQSAHELMQPCLRVCLQDF